MSAQELTVFKLSCDGCDEQLVDSEYGNGLVEETVEQIRDVAESYEWSRDGDDDLCPSCTCARYDHQRRVAANGAYAYCARCDETLLDAVTTEPKAAFL